MQRYVPSEIHVQRVEPSDPRFNSAQSSLVPKSRLSNYGSLSNMLPPPIVKSSIVTASSNPLNVVIKKFSASNTASAESISAKLVKLIRYQKKALFHHNELIRELNLWIATIPSEESRKLIIEFLKCLEVEKNMRSELIQKQEGLKLQLSNIYKREQISEQVRTKREKVSTKLKNAESKAGPSTHLTFLSESIEALDCNLEVVDDQYIRAINAGLKSSFIDYLITFQNTAFSYKQAAKSFFEYNLSKNNDPGSNYKKLFILSPNTNLSQEMSQNYQLPTSKSSAPTSYAQNNYYMPYTATTTQDSRGNVKMPSSSNFKIKPLSSTNGSDMSPGTSGGMQPLTASNKNNIGQAAEEKQKVGQLIASSDFKGQQENISCSADKSAEITNENSFASSNQPANTGGLNVRPTSLGMHEEWS